LQQPRKNTEVESMDRGSRRNRRRRGRKEGVKRDDGQKGENIDKRFGTEKGAENRTVEKLKPKALRDIIMVDR
jgi:hypothetical protein